MKRFFLIVLLSLISVTYIGSALIRSVSNRPQEIPGMYTSVQSAIDAASPGDTLYITPTNLNYGDFTINKSLVITGGRGFSYSSDQFISLVNTIVLSSSNVLIEGLKCQIITGAITTGNDEISIRRCFIVGNIVVSGNNWTIYNNTITGTSSINFQNNDNILVANNIFWVYCGIVFLNSNSSNVAIQNNMIRGLGYYYYYYGATFAYLASQISNCLFSNNIIQDCGYSLLSGVETSIFSNNISNSYNLPFGNNVGENNILGDPMLVNMDCTQEFNFSNFHLQNGSPCIGAGVDGTDICLYGGLFPWSPDLTADVPDYSFQPLIPQIRALTLEYRRISPDGMLHINVSAEKK